MEVKRGNKKVYSRPELEVVSVDNVISMVMETTFSEDEEEDLWGDPTTKQISPTNSPAKTYTLSEEKDPFGGSTPFDN
ncbi:hypothetical protein [Plebeiibacterium marinum]|uniref:Uncharacterized protein n=1 Tax=Plebeiibacterium marinum TaxID=2992111 RepID=A0AAE3ME81_9BACT|nr:hypothetical protein [Plebeiobacterium marinum]MCW3805980.1 hypothetical protein [Plebeiobacterium marinum]